MTDEKTLRAKREGLAAKERDARAEYDLYGDGRSCARWERARDELEVYDLALRALEADGAAEDRCLKRLRRKVDGALGRVRDEHALGKATWTADEVERILLNIRL